MHCSGRALDDNGRRAIAVDCGATGGHRQRAIGNGASRRRNGHLHIIRCTLSDVDRIAHRKTAGDADAGATGQGLVAGHSQRWLIIHRLDDNVRIDRSGFLAIGMIEVGDINLDVHRTIAATGPIKVGNPGIFQVIDRRLHLGHRTDQRDGIAVVAA